MTEPKNGNGTRHSIADLRLLVQASRAKRHDAAMRLQQASDDVVAATPANGTSLGFCGSVASPVAIPKDEAAGELLSALKSARKARRASVAELKRTVARNVVEANAAVYHEITDQDD